MFLVVEGSTVALFFVVAYSGWLLYRVLSWSTFCRLIFVITSSFFLFTWQEYPSIDQRQTTVEGVFPQGFTWNGASLSGVFRTNDGEKLYVTYYAHTKDEKEALLEKESFQYEWRLVGEVSETEPPAHRYAFYMEDYFRQLGVTHLFQVKTFEKKRIRATHTYFLLAQREKVREWIDEVFPPSLRAEAYALIIGDRSEMSQEAKRAYERLGITHLFAISGLHVSIFTFLLRELLLRLSVRHEIVFFLLFFMLPLYAVIAGGAPSVWRAVFMTNILLVAIHTKKIRVDDALGLSAIVYMLFVPESIYHVGFQLSYLATATIIYSAHILKQFHKRWLQGLAITILTQLTLYPIILYHFYEWSLSAFVTNIFYVPLYTVIILPWHICALVGSLIAPQLIQLMMDIYEPFRLFIEHWTIYFGSYNEQMWVLGRPGGVVLFVSFMTIGYFLLRIEKKWYDRKGWLILSLPFLYLTLAPFFDSEGRITFLDVGQGDSIVVELPHRQGVYVIDTGGLLRFEDEEWKKKKRPFDIGRSIVSTYLKGRGISTIDALIITHADSDHMEGAFGLLQEMKVKELHYSKGSEAKQMMNELLVEASAQKISLFHVHRSANWQVGDVSFRYVYPERDAPYKDNDSSLVLVIETPYREIWLTGDLEIDGEHQLIALERMTPRKPVLLKVGHHGSRTSTSDEFLSFLQPDIAIISAGRNSRYGHPHTEVIERLHKRRIQIYDTPTCQTISYRWTKKKESIACTSNEIK